MHELQARRVVVFYSTRDLRGDPMDDGKCEPHVNVDRLVILYDFWCSAGHSDYILILKSTLLW